MADERAANVGVESVLRAYEGMCQNYPYFSVWYTGREKAFQYNGDDLEAAKDFLSTSLRAMDCEGDTALYYLRVHPQKETVYKPGSDVVCALPFRFNAKLNQMGFAGGGYGSNQGIERLISSIETQNKAISDRLAALEAAEPEPELDMLGKITGLLENPNIGPHIGNVIGQVMSAVMQKLVPNACPTPPAQVAISGIDLPGSIAEKSGTAGVEAAGWDEGKTEDYEASVHTQLDRLAAKCDLLADLTRLADIAENNPQMFNMLLNNLRA